MELYIKEIGNITYLSELTLDILNKLLRSKMSRVNSPKQLTFTSFRKLWAHLK